MMNRFGEKKSILSTAVQWASRVTSIALEMIVPPIAGIWLDRKLGTGFAFLAVGAILGFVTGMMSLWGIAKSLSQAQPNPPKD